MFDSPAFSRMIKNYASTDYFTCIYGFNYDHSMWYSFNGFSPRPLLPQN